MAISDPFLAAIILFLLGYLGLVISTFPYLVPPTLTVWQTAAVPASQIFMLLGKLVLLPIILGYIGFVYWLFRGKVRRRRRLSLTQTGEGHNKASVSHQRRQSRVASTL